MLQKLASHNDDIKRLVEKGYAVAVDSNYLVIRDVPYLDAVLALQRGALVTKLEFIDNDRVTQSDHQVWFAGAIPHNLDGKPVPNLAGGPAQVQLSNACVDVVVQRSFSNKPPTGRFPDFFAKIESYVAIISGPAMERHNASPYTFRIVDSAAENSVFLFRDTLTSRAEITDLSQKFADDVIAIIGLGGTGAYLLDFLVRTPVREIRGFDRDPFHVHNAYRSPGRLQEAELGMPKAEVYQARYENFRRGLSLSAKYIDGTCAADLEGVTFAFVCVDKGSSRREIFDLLMSKNIPFIDVGMGLKRTAEGLSGLLRATHYSVPDAARMLAANLAPLTDAKDDLYRANVQIGELNALNAAIAVMRFKQLRGFYAQELGSNHLLFGVSDLRVSGAYE